MNFARVPVLMPVEEKLKFKITTALNSTTMSDVLRDFAIAYNKNPKIYNKLMVTE